MGGERVGHLEYLVNKAEGRDSMRGLEESLRGEERGTNQRGVEGEGVENVKR